MISLVIFCEARRSPLNIIDYGGENVNRNRREDTGLVTIICCLIVRLDKIILAGIKAYQIIRKANHDDKS